MSSELSATPGRCDCLLEALLSGPICVCLLAAAALHPYVKPFWSDPLFWMTGWAGGPGRRGGWVLSFTCTIPHVPALHSLSASLDYLTWCRHPHDCVAASVWISPTGWEATPRAHVFPWRATFSPFSSQYHAPATGKVPHLRLPPLREGGEVSLPLSFCLLGGSCTTTFIHMTVSISQTSMMLWECPLFVYECPFHYVLAGRDYGKSSLCSDIDVTISIILNWDYTWKLENKVIITFTWVLKMFRC